MKYGSKQHPAPPCRTRALCISPPDRLPDPYGGCRRNRHRHHKREAGTVQCNLVPGKWERTEGRDNCRHRGKNGDLHKDLRAHRCADRDQLAQAINLIPPLRLEQTVVMPPLIVDQKNQHDPRLVAP